MELIKMCLPTIIFVTVLAEDRPKVNTSSGILEGTTEYSGFFQKFFAFKGIPFAEPPVGDLRFSNPVPIKAWGGVRDASKHGNVCPNSGIDGFGGGGHEDCLFINVYTPNLKGNLSVMFWVHGGAFLIGSGNSFVYGPNLLLRENVIVVTVNYRLASLGFLSTNDRYAQGNYGLKDVVLALKWVKKNIAVFGGNPERVTVFGQSAGGVTVHLLLLSESSKGLFQQAIIQSGTAFSPFAFQKDTRSQAENLGKKLGLQFNSTESLVKLLRKVAYKKLLKAERGILEMDQPLGLRPFEFSPSIEPEDAKKERFLADSPLALMREGKFHTVPMIIGTNSNEGLLMVREYLLDKKVFDRYNENVSYLVPTSFNLSKANLSEINEVSESLKKLYFNGQNISAETLKGWAEFHTDAQFKFPTDRVIKYFVRNQTHPIYYYNFSFDGELNFLKTLLFLRSFQGACHADEIFYLFAPEFPIPVWPTSHTLKVRKRLVKLWANFAKYSNPTVKTDETIGIKWPEYTVDKEEYLSIGTELKVENHQERIRIWHDFQKRFTGYS